MSKIVNKNNIQPSSMMKALVSFLIFFSIGVQAISQSNAELATKARKAYDASQYNVAVQLYEKILSNGYESAVLYYNLGNAYYRSNNIPSAILYYEKSLKLMPNSEDVIHNLAIANARITDKVEIVPDLFYKRWWNSFVNFIDIDTAGFMLIGLLSLTLLATGIYLVSKWLIIRKFSFWTGLVLLFFFLTSLLAAREKEYLLQNHHEAIVFTPTVTVKSSPDMASTDLFVIHEGIKVVLLDQVGDWQEIRIANGSVGWLRASDLRMI